MDYEKKYKEALERAKELSKTTTGANYEYIFPELKESEDEQIRKILINLVENNGTACYINKIHKNKIFAWLEKQDKQKSNPYSGVSFEYNGHTWGMCARDGGVDIGYDKQLIANINPIREKDEFDNLSKPIDSKEIGCNAGDFIVCIAPNHGI